MRMEGTESKMYFVMFINTKSGNGDGKRFFSLGYPELVIHYQTHPAAHLYFIDLFSDDSKYQGLQLVKNFLNNAIEFRVIICGGDGTIPWVLGELLNEGISLTRVTFGIVPIGTGNDFSRSIGWGAQTVRVSKDNYKDLSELAKKWMNARIMQYDMWDVTIQTFPDGKIYDIKNERSNLRPEKTIKKMFSNYVGLGLDARTVYTMERHRTPYACLNKIAYGLVGCINYFRSLKKLDEKVESITDGSENDPQMDSESLQEPDTLSSNQKGNVPQKNPILARYPIQLGKCGLVCLNCTSYMAGLRKVWQTKSISNVNIDKKNAINYFHEQRVDDGMVEFVSFKNELNLALQRIIRSGSKVFQGSGPFEIKMKLPRSEEITHLQIDGESLKIMNLKSVLIKKTDRITDHKLRVILGDQE